MGFAAIFGRFYTVPTGGTRFTPTFNSPNEVYPPAEDVELGVVYGPDGNNFTGTLTGGGSPADPPLCTVTFSLVDQYGEALASEPVEITFLKYTVDASTTPAVLSPPPVQTTDVDGLVSVSLLRDAVYKIIYGNAPYTRRVDVTIPDASTYSVSL